MIASLQKAFLELLDAGLDEDSCIDIYLNTVDATPIPRDLTTVEKRLGDEFINAFNLCLQSGMETADIIDECFNALAARSVTGTLVIDYSDLSSSRRIWALRKSEDMSDCRRNIPQDSRVNKPVDSRVRHAEEKRDEAEQAIREIQKDLVMLETARWETAATCRAAYQSGQLTRSLYEQLNSDYMSIRRRQHELEAILEAI